MNETEQGLLESFVLTDGQRLIVEHAHKEAPRGLIAIALESRRYGLARGNNGVGLLMHRIARGEHYDEELALEPSRSRRTGWRYVRGSHAGTFIQDPEGTDALPREYGPE